MAEIPANENPSAGSDQPGTAAPEKKKRKINGFNALEIADQVDEARELLIQGNRPNLVRHHLREKWGLHNDTADRRISAARRKMVEDLECVDRKEKAAQLLEAAEDILKMARETRQLSNALGALSFQARVLGLEQRQN